MTIRLEGVKHNPIPNNEDLRRMSLIINELVKNLNKGFTEIPIGDTITGDATLNDTATVIPVDATSGNITLTLLPAADVKNRVYYIKKIDSSSNTVTIDGNGGETIDGATTKVISSQFVSHLIISTGTEWWIL